MTETSEHIIGVQPPGSDLDFASAMTTMSVVTGCPTMSDDAGNLRVNVTHANDRIKELVRQRLKDAGYEVQG